MLKSKSSLPADEKAIGHGIVDELRRAQEDEAAMQRHLQRMKDPRGLETLNSLRTKIAKLEDRLDIAED